MLQRVTAQRVNGWRGPVNAGLAAILLSTIAQAGETAIDAGIAHGQGFDWSAPAILLAGVLMLAFFFAKLEIQIEGPDGWASRLPTWRVEKHPLLDWFWGGRPMTGYHAWAFAFVGLTFHTPYLFGCVPSWRMEARMLGGLMIFWIVEDALWFALNPAFGLRRLTREVVWWHKRWIGPVPVDYVTFTLAACVLLTYSFWK
jgi:hypothetical protein